MEKQVRRRRSKSVAFAALCEVRRHLHRSDMTDFEIASTWFSREERRLTELEAKTTIGYMRHRPEQVTEENKRSARGLEHLVKSSVVRTRRKIKQNVMNAVFIEQERQLLGTSMPNADVIRSASRYHSKPSEQRAIKLAEADTEYVMNMLIIEDLNASRSSERSASRRQSLQYWDEMRKCDSASTSSEARGDDFIHWDEMEKDDDASHSTARTSNRRHSMVGTRHRDEVEGKEEEKGDNDSHPMTRNAERRHSMPAKLNLWTTGTAA